MYAHTKLTQIAQTRFNARFYFNYDAGDPPEPEELIRALLNLENSASSDANIRERIASLPPEVSEISMLAKLEDKEAASKLVLQVFNANLLELRLEMYHLRKAI